MPTMKTKMKSVKSSKLDGLIAPTASYAKQLIAAGWEREQAIVNSQNLYHLSDKRMRQVEALIPE